MVLLFQSAMDGRSDEWKMMKTEILLAGRCLDADLVTDLVNFFSWGSANSDSYFFSGDSGCGSCFVVWKM